MLRADFLLSAAHRQVPRLRQHVHSLSYLRIVGRDEDPVSHHPPVRGSDDVEAQLTFEVRTISIDHRSRDLVRRIGEHETAKRFEDRVRHLELIGLELVTEIDGSRYPACLETTNPAIHKLARESKNRARQTSLR